VGGHRQVTVALVTPAIVDIVFTPVGALLVPMRGIIRAQDEEVLGSIRRMLSDGMEYSLGALPDADKHRRTLLLRKKEIYPYAYREPLPAD